MGKTETTKFLEKIIFNKFNNLSTFCAFEVTIGWHGKERVDMLSYDTSGIFRCFEIKVSKEDFYSSAKKTFLGHYNYFVMTKELYNIVEKDIPKGIGVYIEDICVKKAEKQDVADYILERLKDSMIRSLSRDANKYILSNEESELDKKNREITELRRQVKNYREKYQELHYIYEKNGRRYNMKHYPEFFMKGEKND